jgi:hypothetical protein
MNVNEVKEKHMRELMTKPNVVGVGIGERNGAPVLEVFVRSKVPRESLHSSGIIPDTLDGFPVHVVEIGSPSV